MGGWYYYRRERNKSNVLIHLVCLSDLVFSHLITSTLGRANISETKLAFADDLTKARAQSLQQLLCSPARNWAAASVWPAHTVARKRWQRDTCSCECIPHVTPSPITHKAIYSRFLQDPLQFLVFYHTEDPAWGRATRKGHADRKKGQGEQRI